MYTFRCFGNKNITSSHKNTLEFTKDKEISKLAHCIIGVKADFDLKKLKELIKNKEKLKIIIQTNNLKEEINCLKNKNFNDNREIVIRRSEFSSKRTLGTRCDKTSKDLNPKIKQMLKDPEQGITVKII
ncbi:DUF371 domain-containing protein [Candidatus Woesearchaeota archaeon]|nr:DUF371 domain-containing protein [Candidatus Woesearchaeota archaeon]